MDFGGKRKFVVRLCNDVLLEALLYATRRQLAELEPTGNRFYRLVDGAIGHAPILLLNLNVVPGYLILIFYKYKYKMKGDNFVKRL